MTTIKLKPNTPIYILSKPYMVGTFSGIIIGMGLAKMVQDMIRGYQYGITTGFIIFCIGMYVWYKLFREDKLK
jgi:hypothetical protein